MLFIAAHPEIERKTKKHPSVVCALSFRVQDGGAEPGCGSEMKNKPAFSPLGGPDESRGFTRNTFYDHVGAQRVPWTAAVIRAVSQDQPDRSEACLSASHSATFHSHFMASPSYVGVHISRFISGWRAFWKRKRKEKKTYHHALRRPRCCTWSPPAGSGRTTWMKASTVWILVSFFFLSM